MVIMLPLTSHTILIADDDRPLRLLLRVVLEGAGARVVEAAHGFQALRLLNMNPTEFDAIVTDLAMPGLDGESFVRLVRGQGDPVPIVICSASGMLNRHPLVREHLVDGAVAKPFSPERLIRSIVQAIETRAAAQSLAQTS